jgi:hypothetical protein
LAPLADIDFQFTWFACEGVNQLLFLRYEEEDLLHEGCFISQVSSQSNDVPHSVYPLINRGRMKRRAVASFVLVETGGEEESDQDTFPEGGDGASDTFECASDNDDLEPAVDARDRGEDTK